MEISILTTYFSSKYKTIRFIELAKQFVKLGNRVSVVEGPGKACTANGNLIVYKSAVRFQNAGAFGRGLLPIFSSKTLKELDEETDVFVAHNIHGFMLDKFISKPWIVQIPSLSKEGLSVLNNVTVSSFGQKLMKYLSMFYVVPQAIYQWYAIKQSSKISASCRRTKHGIIRNYGINEEKIYVAPGGVDVEKFRPAPSDYLQEKLCLPRNAKIVLYVGRTTLSKGFFSLLKSMSEVAGHHKVYFVIVGNNPLKGFLNLAPRKLRDNIKLVDWVPHREMPNIYNSACMLVHGSYFEGTPLTILEAMASGIPVIAREVGGIPEIISDNQEGCIVKSSEDLTEKIGMLLKDDGLAERMGVKGREKVIECFDWKRIAMVELAQYKSLVT